MTNEILYDEIVICLYDGKYHFGVAALVNSLANSKFKGLINVGHRGKLPPWVNQLETIEGNYYYLTNEIVIHFTLVDTEIHLGYFKPYFIKETIDRYKSTAKFYYFDADITIYAPWKLFSNWLDTGICLCLDHCFHFIHFNHPWRKDWRKLNSNDKKLFNDINYYFNSGFIGIERESVSLIEKWIYFTELYIKMGGDTNSFIKDAYSSYKGDQDLLNAAITTTSGIEIAIMGKEGMGFTQPATLMMHAIGNIKPWDSNFFGELIKCGKKPSLADKTFFFYSKYPIKIFPPFKYGIKKLNLFSASFFGRLLG